jgi:hypothetical protein
VHLVAEAGTDEGADGVRLDRRARPQYLGGGSELAPPREQPCAGELAEFGGKPEHEALGDAVHAVPPHRGGAAGGGHELVAEPELACPLRRPRDAGEERVGTLVDRVEAGER